MKAEDRQNEARPKPYVETLGELNGSALGRLEDAFTHLRRVADCEGGSGSSGLTAAYVGALNNIAYLAEDARKTARGFGRR